MRLIATATKKGKCIRKPYNSTCKTLSLKFEYTFLSKKRYVIFKPNLERHPAQKRTIFSIKASIFLNFYWEKWESLIYHLCTKVRFKPKVRMYQCLFYVRCWCMPLAPPTETFWPFPWPKINPPFKNIQTKSWMKSLGLF